MARVDAYEKITEQITSMLETGTVPWRKPWNAAGSAPTSLSTGKPYRGINVMILSMTALVEGYASPFWGTYKQITERGGQVNKGEKATHVTLWTKAESKKEKDANGTGTGGGGRASGGQDCQVCGIRGRGRGRAGDHAHGDQAR